MSLERLFRGLRAHSKFALSQAIAACDAPGVGATLVVQIPSDPSKPAEVYFTTAPSSLVSDLWKAPK